MYAYAFVELVILCWPLFAVEKPGYVFDGCNVTIDVATERRRESLKLCYFKKFYCLTGYVKIRQDGRGEVIC